MGEILVGACSWTDPALVRSGWYPKGSRDPEGRLRHYATRLPVVEVDSGYYALPSARNSRLWVERTPDGFVFDVKAFSLLTGHPTRRGALPPDLREVPDPTDPRVLDAVWERFAEAIGPLRDGGRLGSVLFQFPPWFRPGAPAGEFLAQCAERTAKWPVSVEFRHPAWWREEQADATATLLRGHGFAAVAVDMAQTLPSSVPPVTPVTSPRLGVVRFHGRSTAWGAGSKEDRFRYEYADAELAEWVPRLRALAARVERLHVLFNNCCADAAVRAAERMRALLDGG
ncbi:DUF72 domain-containing protein [Streptomyces naganishii]|uniref:DUF72 domain-containing protein n=1 Tax=Streptomyces naganishii JCM 4654 TaxID=1306179 RepID=A0A918XZ31_9ACTN|nr:DUF72 domain-containing protein [Streptomyces naganishii]GHD84846.1 hypothetical protein GCM10010508_06240 [Streptomyces naganishii JCM 4654]